MPSKKIFLTLTVLVLVLVASGCTPKDPLAELYGTWSTDTVPVSGYGYFDGIATHQYGEDGTYRADVDFTDPDSGCHVTLYYTGTFTGNETTLQFTATEGEVEVSSCTDESSNAPNRAYGEEELAAASTNVEWTVDGDTLTLLHEDGMDRVYQRQ